MCGRYALYTRPEELAGLFELAEIPELSPRYNIAPMQWTGVIRQEEDRRRIVLMRWGLIPSWAKDEKIASSTINARAETAASKPAFRTAVRRRRCLVPADGFFEWQAVAGRKQPLYFQRRDARPFAIAGLWEQWQPEGVEPLLTCTVLTTEANELVRPVHDRMPVILDPADYALWLDPTVQDPERLQPLLRPAPAGDMTARPVQPRVNQVRQEGPGCIEPLAEQPSLFDLAQGK
jgi:putative SOS response-associated peptidase YedK